MVEIDVCCEDCTWSESCTVKEMPIFCPDCGGQVVRESEPQNPEKTLTDKIGSLDDMEYDHPREEDDVREVMGTDDN